MLVLVKRSLNKEICLVSTDFCNESLIGEFIAAERYGQQGASANAYRNCLYLNIQYQLITEEKLVLKAVLLSNKIGVKVESKAKLFGITRAIEWSKQWSYKFGSSLR